MTSVVSKIFPGLGAYYINVVAITDEGDDCPADWPPKIFPPPPPPPQERFVKLHSRVIV